MALRPFRKVLHSAWQDLKNDLKSTRWRRGWGWTAGVFWIFGLPVSLSMVVLLPLFMADDKACQPDGEFRLHPETFSTWSSTGFFQITLGGGNLTFAEAKAVDVIWDIGVGRGGQLLLALISWRQFARYLTICMESEPITYQLFRTIFIENDASVLSTCRTIKSFVWQRKLRSNIAMTFMIATMIFILAFPTLVSAMSGYDSNVASRVSDRDGNLIFFDSFSMALYVIHDGWRLNQSGDYWVTGDTSRGEDPVMSSYSSCWFRNYTESSDIGCDDLESVSRYVAAYGLGGTLNESSRFYNHTANLTITLPAPTLNISIFAGAPEHLPGRKSLQVQNVTWVRQNQTFDYEFMKANGKCPNTGDYKWGFSFLQLFICIILLFAWTVGMYIMWIYTHYTLALRSRVPEQISGENRAILELAAAMQNELEVQHVDPCLLREKQLKEKISGEIRGGSISYAYADSAPKFHSIRRAIKIWFAANKWWLLAMLTVSVLISTLWMKAFVVLGSCWFWFWCWLPSIWFGQFWAFCIGKTTGSRSLIILFWASLGGIIIIGCAVAYEVKYRACYSSGYDC